MLDNPRITDQEFDKYLREIIDIEVMNPSIVREDSPTKKLVGKF